MAWRQLKRRPMGPDSSSSARTVSPPKGGRRVADARHCFEGILRILWTGAPWSEWRRYGSPSISVGDACGSGNAVGCCWSCGGSSSPSSMTNRNSAGVNAFWMLRTGEKGDLKVGPTKCGKGTTWMVLVDGAGTPLGAYLGSASPAKVRLLEATLDTVAIGQASGGRPRKLPDRLIERATHQDGHRLRRYRHRWIVERTIGWLGNFRCLTVRYEWLLETYSGFFI